MPQKKQAGKKNKKSAGKKSSSKPVSQTARKTAKAGMKKKAAGANKKKQAPTGKKSSVKKPSPAKSKSARIKKTPEKRIEKKKTVAKSAVKTRKVMETPGKAKAKTKAKTKASARPSLSELTATERYSAGGLFACAIERTSDPDFKRLRSVLRELDLPSLEKDNLIRLSQGFTIPKLFADSIAPHKAGSLVEGLVKFAVGDGGYERKWKNDIRQVAVWLGIEGPAVEAIERRAASN